MISKLDIQNFQSHKRSTLDFSPGVNVIVGSSDSGKSAIFRALRWLIWNRPGGDAFRSTWGGETRVVVVTEENDTITRLKEKSGNFYFMDEEELVAFGAGVPEVIQKALNIDETNIQRQGDNPFLISSTPGEVASYFNQIAHLDQIDIGLKYLTGNLRKLDSKHGFLKEQIEEHKEDLEKFKYLEKAEIDLEVVEGMEETKVRVGKGLASLEKSISSLIEIDREEGKLQKILKYENQVNEIIQMLKEIESKEEALTTLQNRSEELEKLDAWVKAIDNLLVVEKDANSILKMLEKKEAIRKEGEELWLAMSWLSENKSLLNEATITLEQLEKEFHEQMPEICPLCNQKIG